MSYRREVKYWESKDGNIVFRRAKNLSAGMIPFSAIKNSSGTSEIKAINKILNDTWREIPDRVYKFKIIELNFYKNGVYVEFYDEDGHMYTEVIFITKPTGVSKYVYDIIKDTPRSNRRILTTV